MTNPVIATKDGKVDWMQYARWWPVVAGIAVCGFWLGGRLESPEMKQGRIDMSLNPILVRLDHIEEKIDSTIAVEEEETRILGRLTDAVEKFVDFQIANSPTR